MCFLYSLGACGTGHVCVCVVVPASLARHFDDVDLRYFYFSQSSFASLNLAQPPDTVDISHYTGLQHCLNLPHASLATKRAGKFPTGFRAHSLSHVSISSIRRRESGIDRRHHQSRVTAIRTTTTTRYQLCAIHNAPLPLLARIKWHFVVGPRSNEQFFK